MTLICTLVFSFVFTNANGSFSETADYECRAVSDNVCENTADEIALTSDES